LAAVYCPSTQYRAVANTEQGRIQGNDLAEAVGRNIGNDEVRLVLVPEFDREEDTIGSRLVAAGHQHIDIA
jgi:hypothetical protein